MPLFFGRVLYSEGQVGLKLLATLLGVPVNAHFMPSSGLFPP